MREKYLTMKNTLVKEHDYPPFILFLASIFIILIVCAFPANATDSIKILKPILGFDKRAQHKDEVIIRSLEITEAEFGPFTFEAVNVDMTPSRALASIKTGNLINTFIAPASDVWDKSAIPIKVPIRQGLLSYRLLLINKQDLTKYKGVQTLDELNQLTAGLQHGWITTKIFKELEMNMITGHNFEGLFLMLNKHRFNYLPRAIYEIYDEFESRKEQLNNVIIEPTLALYLPMVTYVYVSPTEPLIAKRINAGLRKLVATGELTEILNKYYEKDIQKANLSNRHIIKINNPYFDDKAVLNDKTLWFQHND